MTIIEQVKKKFKKVLLSGESSNKLASSFCIGLYIAFSPFPGAHTIMMIISKYIFKLNFPVLFFATSINNPWTMIPFFSCDYVFGYWFVHSVLSCNPSWYISLVPLFGRGRVCVWSFLIGGNILGILVAVLLWPCMKIIFNHLSTECYDG